MTVWTLGSINIDHVHHVDRLPRPGETLAAESYSRGLGGKGANQSVAAARAGVRVHHIGAVGADGLWARAELAAYDVDVTHVAELDAPTGHAMICVDPAGENAIVIHAGANAMLDEAAVEAALGAAEAGDTLLLQNETSGQLAAARRAHAAGMRVIYSAAPFEAAAVEAVLPHVTTLVLNAVEAEMLGTALARPLEALPVGAVVVTRGSQGAQWIAAGADQIVAPAFRVAPVDTTGAGDCFAGTLAAMLDAGMAPREAMRMAAAAAAIQVTRPGTAAANPDRAEVIAFLAAQG